MTPFYAMAGTLAAGVILMACSVALEPAAAAWCLYGLGALMVVVVVLRLVDVP